MKINIFITAFLLLIFSTSNAQVDMQNTGILYVSGGSDILYINGAFTNTNTATLTNNGNLYVSRNLTNGQAVMTVGTGTLYLNGSVAQVVGGAQPFKTYNFISDNSAGITLNSNLSVSGVHTFTNGVITTAVTPKYLIYETGASHTGATDSRHVNGWVKKFGTTDFVFPVGNGTYLRSAEIKSLSSNSEFNCKYNAPTINPLNVLAPILLADNNEYWDIPQISGGTAQINLNWDNNKVIFPRYPLTEIRVVNYASSLWTDRGGAATGDIYNAGSITSGTVNSFGYFTFGSLDWFVAQRLLLFTAQRKQGFTSLEWVAGNENGTKSYEVERSENEKDFYGIGGIPALQNLSQNKYHFDDYKALSGTAWYRIKSIYPNGQVLFSTVKAVTENAASGSSFYVLNNPVHQNIYIAATGIYTGEYDYSIYNAAGQLVQKGTINSAAGGINTIPLETAISKGVYILNVKNKLHRMTQRLIVQ